MGELKQGGGGLRTGLLGVAMATAAFFWFDGDTRIIRHWSRQAVSEDTPRTRRRLLMAQTLGPNGVPLLVGGLASRSRRVVDASSRGLEELLQAWRHLPPEEASRGVLVMSSEMARQADRFSPRGRQAAEILVRRLALWPVPRGVGDRSRILANCELALRRIQPLTDDEIARLVRTDLPPAEPDEAAARDDVPASTQPEPQSAAPDQPPELQDSELFPLWLETPGGNLPWEPATVSPLPPLPPPRPRLLPSPADAPRKLEPPPTQRPAELVRPPRAQPLGPKRDSSRFGSM